MTKLKSPDWIDRVDGITKIVQNPCDAPWTVYVETAGRPAANLVITLLTFGLLDVMRGYFRPKNLRSHRHGRRGRRGGRRFFKIPEFGEVIAKRLPGQQAVANREVSTGVKKLWIIDGVLQRILWYWLVVDAVGTFFYEWSALIEQSGFCEQEDLGRSLWMDQEGGYPGVAGWVGPTGGSKLYEALTVTITQNSVTVGKGHYQVVASIKLTNQDTSLADVGVRLTQIGPPDVTLDVEFEENIGQGQSAELVVAATVRGPASVSFEARSDGGSSLGENGVLWCQQTSLE